MKFCKGINLILMFALAPSMFGAQHAANRHLKKAEQLFTQDQKNIREVKNLIQLIERNIQKTSGNIQRNLQKRANQVISQLKTIVAKDAVNKKVAQRALATQLQEKELKRLDEEWQMTMTEIRNAFTNAMGAMQDQRISFKQKLKIFDESEAIFAPAIEKLNDILLQAKATPLYQPLNNEHFALTGVYNKFLIDYQKLKEDVELQKTGTEAPVHLVLRHDLTAWWSKNTDDLNDTIQEVYTMLNFNHIFRGNVQKLEAIEEKMDHISLLEKSITKFINTRLKELHKSDKEFIQQEFDELKDNLKKLSNKVEQVKKELSS